MEWKKGEANAIFYKISPMGLNRKEKPGKCEIQLSERGSVGLMTLMLMLQLL
jgi:hypothetical protein